MCGIGIEEVADELLGVGGGLAQHLHGDRRQFVLVVRQPELAPVEGWVLSVKSLDPVIKLSLVATLPFNFLHIEVGEIHRPGCCCCYSPGRT